MGESSKMLSVYLGRDKIKIAYCITQKEKIILHQAFQVATPEGAMVEGRIADKKLVSHAILDGLKENRIKAKQVRFCIFSPAIITREIELPAIGKAKLEQIIYNNIADYFPIDVTNYLVAYHTMEIIEDKEEKVAKKAKILLVATPSKVIHEYESLAESLRLELVGIDYQEDSIYHYIKLQKLESTNLWLHIGSDATTIGVVSNGKNELMKTISYGTTTFVEALVNQYNITPEEAVKKLFHENLLDKDENPELAVTDEFLNTLKYMLQSIGTYLKYYTNKKDANTIDCIYVIGEGTKIKGISNLIEEILGLETVLRYSDVGIIYKGDTANQAKDINMEVCIGAALSKLSLIPSYNKKESNTGNQMRYIAIGGAIIALSVAAAIAFPAYKIMDLNKEKIVLQEQLDAYQEIAVLKGEYDTLQKSYEERKYIIDLANTPTNGLTDLFVLLEKNIPEGIMIQTATSNEAGLTMNCTAKDRLSVANFISEMKKLPTLQDVFVGSITETEEQEGGGKIIQFPITCLYKEVAKP